MWLGERAFLQIWKHLGAKEEGWGRLEWSADANSGAELRKIVLTRAYIVHAVRGTGATVISAKGPNCYPRKSVHAIFDLKAATEQCGRVLYALVITPPLPLWKASAVKRKT
uniref:Uncharacterized protein n=1 Tax=Ascaris lumbricoides TaxID=6252 RepID=A0A0M3HRM1_ASCLU